ncbi:hypothetical protein [Shinella fusca]|jgi:hypothetical protein|uniref:Uncharacterized protein n=1 Tax=Shinella fusca TaxID=544480 RepID=A0A7W7YRK3_9HYPH|nr:hypothetical protein [Shinella fusca]MBB5040845.1 hypothetical protein [Shinella fusca]
MNRLIRKAVLSWQSFRARRRLERTIRNTERVLPDLAKNKRAIAIGRRHHRATRHALEAQQALILSALRKEV